MSKTTIVLDVFRAADNAGILMESVCEHFGISAEAAFSCAQRQDKESGAPLTAPAPLTDELPELPVPLEIDWPQLHSQALGCGVEDRSIHDRYEAAEYGWQVGMEAAAECVPELIYDEEAVLAIQREAYELGRDKAAPAPQQSMLTDERIEELFMPMMPWLPSKHGLQQFARVIEREVAKAAPAAPVQTAEPKRIPDMLTVETIQGAIAFGRMGINPPPSPDHWGNEFWQIGRQLAKLGETSAWDNVTPVDVAAPVQADQVQAEQAAAVRAARHPVQPLVIAERGRIRFKRNHIVEHLAEGKLNDLAAMDFPQEDWEQLAQLIGYSLDGFGTLSYVTDETYERAAAQDPITAPSTATSNDTGALGEKGAEA